MDPQQPAPSATPVEPVTGNVLDGVDATLQGAAGLPSAVTHDLSVAERARRVITMRAGLVQEDRQR